MNSDIINDCRLRNCYVKLERLDFTKLTGIKLKKKYIKIMSNESSSAEEEKDKDSEVKILEGLVKKCYVKLERMSDKQIKDRIKVRRVNLQIKGSLAKKILKVKPTEVSDRPHDLFSGCTIIAKDLQPEEVS